MKDASTQAGPPQAELPLVIGITGHRDLVKDQEAAITQALLDQFDGFAAEYRSTPLILLSPLAEGADRLAAETALQWNAKRRESGASTIQVVAPLPMPLEAYSVDFLEKDSEAGFRKLLQHPDVTCFQLPGKSAPPVEDLIDCKQLRDDAYARLASFLSRNCHVLIALWEGASADEVARPGGTAQVVQRFCDGVDGMPSADDDPLDVPDGLVLVHMRVARRRRKQHPPFRCTTPSCSEDGPGIIKLLDTFNQDADEAGDLAQARETSRDYLLPRRIQEERSDQLEDYLAAFGLADALSTERFQKRWFRTMGLLIAFPSLAIILFETYCHLMPGTQPLLLGYLIASTVSIAILSRSKSRRLESKYLVYRSFAEALRVQVGLCLAGDPHSVAGIYDRMHRRDIEWVRQALKGVHIRQMARSGGGPPADRDRGAGVRGFQLAVRHWVIDQEKWMFKKAGEHTTKHVRMHRVAKILASLSVAACVALLLFGFQGSPPAGIESHPHRMEHIGIVAIVLLLASSAIVHEYSKRMGHGALSQRYDSMGDLFLRARNRVESILKCSHGDKDNPIDPHPQALAVLQSLAREALSENVSWLLFRRDHPLEIHSS